MKIKTEKTRTEFHIIEFIKIKQNLKIGIWEERKLEQNRIDQKNKNKFHENRLQIKKIRSDIWKKEQNSITDLWRKAAIIKIKREKTWI